MIKTLKSYPDYNFRRYGSPWAAIVDPSTGKPDFSRKISGYTGGAHGAAGDLYIIDPAENAVYMYGQKDYRAANKSERNYAVYRNGEFAPVAAEDLIATLAASNVTAENIAEDAEDADAENTETPENIETTETTESAENAENAENITTENADAENTGKTAVNKILDGAIFDCAALKKAVKAADPIVCRVYDDDAESVYISNSHWIIRLNADMYNSIVAPVTKTAPGNYRIDKKSKDAAPVFTQPIDLRGIMSKETERAADPVEFPPMMFTLSRGNDSANTTPILAGGNVYFYNSQYMSIISVTGEHTLKATNRSMLAIASDGKPAAMILPLTSDPAAVRAVKAYHSPADENDKIKAENAELKNKLAAIEKELAALKADKTSAASAANAAAEKPAKKTTKSSAPQTPAEKAAEIADKLNALGMTVKINGAQTDRPVIWISGNTDDHADDLKKSGAKYSAKKSAYWINVA